MNLEKLILRKYEIELKEAERICHEASVDDFEFYADLYIDSREYVNREYENNTDVQKTMNKYLALYTTNSLYESYLKHKKE